MVQSSEIYDGLSAVYDYAQNGAELKKNIRDYWWRAMVQLHENIVGIDAAIFTVKITRAVGRQVVQFSEYTGGLGNDIFNLLLFIVPNEMI